MSVNRKLWNSEKREQGVQVGRIPQYQALLSLDSHYVFVSEKRNNMATAIVYIYTGCGNLIILEIIHVVCMWCIGMYVFETVVDYSYLLVEAFPIDLYFII